MDPVRHVAVEALAILRQYRRPVRRVVDELQLPLLRHATIHLVVIGDRRPAFEMHPDRRVHRHQDDLGIRLRREDAVDHLLKVRPRLGDRSLVLQEGVVDSELDQHRVRLLRDDPSVEILDPPLRPHPALAAVHHLRPPRPARFERRAELADPGPAGGQAGAVGHHGLRLAGLEILDQAGTGLSDREQPAHREKKPGFHQAGKSEVHGSDTGAAQPKRIPAATGSPGCAALP